MVGDKKNKLYKIQIILKYNKVNITVSINIIGLMEEKDELGNFESFIDKKTESLWKQVNPVNGSDEQYKKGYEEMCKFYNFIFGKKKTKKIYDEDIKQHYNVYVYRDYPYPPGTKNKNRQ